MKGYDASTYGDRIADVYDEWHGDLDPAEAVAVLAELAGAGPALELGIGTGRVALPLAAAGVEVHGVDASERMVERLHGKPGGADIPVTMGDFADVPVQGNYRLVYVVFNTFFALLTQADQVRCFANVAGRLTEDGVFLITAFVPDLTRFDRGQRVGVERADADDVRLEVTRHDAAEQRVSTQQVLLRPDGIRFQPVELRYAWPSELDLMAQLAGLRLRERWADWSRTPFGAASTQHVSVYARA